MGGVVDMITGKSPKNKAAEAAMKQQEAIQKRAQLREDDRAEELSKREASQRRAVNARRRGGTSTTYTGPAGGLKSTLGG